MHAMAREARRIGFSLNYAGIFNHRSMEKDKLSILDMWGAYGQKDIEILDRSGPARPEINKPTRDNRGRLADQNKNSFWFIRIYSIIGAWRRTNFLFWMCVVLTARKTAERMNEKQLKFLSLTILT